MLEATNYNYELVASIGGWISTHVLKRYYGEINDNRKIIELKKAMGENITEEKKIFKF